MNSDFLLNHYQTLINKGLFENNTVRDFTGDNKRAYRLLIVHTMVASFFNDEPEYNWAQFKISIMFMEKNMINKVAVNDQFITEIKKRALKYLCMEKEFKFIDSIGGEIELSVINDNKLQNCVNFLQKYVKNGKTLFLYEELQEFWDLNSLYKKSLNNHTEVMIHHWIELVPFVYPMPVHTYPEFFAYHDMINLWNEMIEKYDIIKDLDFSIKDDSRKFFYSYNSLLRNTLVIGVHFFETYLYYLFYNIKSKGLFNKNKLICRNDVRKINDKSILKDLLFKEYVGLENTTVDLHDKYLETLDYRDAFVHMSAFNEKGISRMQYLVDINILFVSESLQNIVEFIQLIEKEVGTDNILFWKEKIEWPNFIKLEKINNLIIKD